MCVRVNLRMSAMCVRVNVRSSVKEPTVSLLLFLLCGWVGGWVGGWCRGWAGMCVGGSVIESGFCVWEEDAVDFLKMSSIKKPTSFFSFFLLSGYLCV